jgi:hypothetical protein
VNIHHTAVSTSADRLSHHLSREVSVWMRIGEEGEMYIIGSVSPLDNPNGSLALAQLLRRVAEYLVAREESGGK